MNPRQIGINRIGECGTAAFLAGDFPQAREEVVLAGGMIYPAGSALGKATANGVCSLVDSSRSDGGEKLHGILAEEVDATAGDAVGIALLTGEFAAPRLTFGGADAAADHKDGARALCIFFKDAALHPDQ